MNTMMSRMSPGATTMIRMDHTHALATFHRYRLDAPADRKRAIADTLCLALEIHSRLEEEIFYPAMHRFDPELVDKSIPEHNEMRRLIARLRELDAGDASFDTTVMDLMRAVIRHVADEETILLPDAERQLAGELSELGARMTRRRFELAGPHAGEIAVKTVRTFPGITLAVTGVVVLGAFLAGLVMTRPSRGVARLASAKALRKLPRPDRLRDTTRALTSRLASAVAR